jgi:tripartite-type tricarboxylate transporter receptor subunit TctC
MALPFKGFESRGIVGRRVQELSSVCAGCGETLIHGQQGSHNLLAKPTMNKRFFLVAHRSTRAWLVAITLALTAPIAAHAQSWPDRPLRLVIPFGAGSAVDTIGRTIATQVAAQIGQPVVIDNRTGANGIIAAEMVAKAPADGTTLFMPNDGILAANPVLYSRLPYDTLRDFAAVTLTSTVPLALVVNPAFPVNSVSELIAQAKARPGAIDFTSTGVGSAQHLAMEFLIDLAAVRMNHVPHKAMAQAITDVVSGNIPVMFSGMSNVIGFVRDGKLRLLGISSSKRSAAQPQWPTIAESGLPGYSYMAWNGIVVASGTPAPLIGRLHEEISRAMAEPSVREKLSSLGFELVGAGPDVFGALIRDDVARLGRLVKAAGITPN